ncbi:MAG: 4-(cytidine 5'-diphospho)-2-C-methyl-D-erythritol kinase [Alphaproteobacteria bacterium]|nr:4-(cytidine 5'-diphospho)-2-C-methyl-D-erythritol kinase [Alphaproteobacteria bacterium]
MSSLQTKTLTVFAPAKINLYLHVTGRLDNGYHTLDSLVTFADTGDEIEIAQAGDFEFRIVGPGANGFTAKERDASPDSSNLAVQAAWALAMAAQKPLKLRITLTKNLPMAAGLGGGSADAAAVLWGLCEWWNISKSAPYLNGLMARLGADVPVCLSCHPARVRGIGDIMDRAPALPETPIVLVNPGIPCPTKNVFMRYRGMMSEPMPMPENFEGFAGFVSFLQDRRNDLLAPALEIAPEIRNVLAALHKQKGCALARMSGSGATCFGLFESEAAAQKAARNIAFSHKGWWVRSGWLGRPERY